MSLFDANNKYKVDAQDLDADVSAELQGYFQKYVELGYSPREISHIIMLAVMGLEMEFMLEGRYEVANRSQSNR